MSIYIVEKINQLECNKLSKVEKRNRLINNSIEVYRLYNQ